jgi:hypothetical protein
MTDSSVYELTDGETPLVNLNRSPQDHTFPGKRGDTLVEGVTYRDVYEAVQVGINRAAGESDDNDVFNINMDADRENRLVQVARDYDETFAEEPVTLDRMEEI